MATVILDFEQAGATAATLLLKAIADRSTRIGAGVGPVSDAGEN